MTVLWSPFSCRRTKAGLIYISLWSSLPFYAGFGVSSYDWHVDALEPEKRLLLRSFGSKEWVFNHIRIMRFSSWDLYKSPWYCSRIFWIVLIWYYYLFVLFCLPMQVEFIGCYEFLRIYDVALAALWCVFRLMR